MAGVRRYRTAGLGDAAEGRSRLEGRRRAFRMDYRLIPLPEGAGIPHQALLIAEAMGMPREIVEEARRRIPGMPVPPRARKCPVRGGKECRKNR